MKTLKWFEKPAGQIRIGLVFLILASLSRWTLQPVGGLSEPWADAVIGLLYGVSIGLMLIGVRRRGREEPAMSCF